MQVKEKITGMFYFQVTAFAFTDSRHTHTEAHRHRHRHGDAQTGMAATAISDVDLLINTIMHVWRFQFHYNLMAVRNKEIKKKLFASIC